MSNQVSQLTARIRELEAENKALKDDLHHRYAMAALTGLASKHFTVINSEDLDQCHFYARKMIQKCKEQ